MVPRHGRIGTTEIINRLEREQGISVHHRTVQRDLNNLSVLFPLISDNKNPAGWSWAPDAPLFDLPGMDPPTAITFGLMERFLAPLLPRPALTTMAPHFAKARKLLEETEPATALRWTEKVRVVERGLPMQPPPVEEATLNAVYDALYRNRRLAVCYHRRGEEEQKNSEVNPLGLIFQDGVIYLVCTFWEYQDVKLLPLHRMTVATVLDKELSMPVGFSLDKYLESGEFLFPEGQGNLKLQVLFEGWVAEHLAESSISTDQTLTVRKDGRVLLSATVRDSSQLRWWLLGFGDRVEVMKPKRLRDEFREIVANLGGRYVMTSQRNCE
jgi:predicted DNA-binding transcriptional regulator YafY